jgi:hypothetical protein
MGKFGPASEHEVSDVLAKELATFQYGRFNDSVNANGALAGQIPPHIGLCMSVIFLFRYLEIDRFPI